MNMGDLVIPGDSTAKPAVEGALEAFADCSIDGYTKVRSGDPTDLDWIKENAPGQFAAHILAMFTTANHAAVHLLVDDNEWSKAKELGDKNRRLGMALNTWMLDPDVQDLIETERKRYLQWRVEFKGDDFRAARDKIFGQPQQ